MRRTVAGLLAVLVMSTSGCAFVPAGSAQRAGEPGPRVAGAKPRADGGVVHVAAGHGRTPAVVVRIVDGDTLIVRAARSGSVLGSVLGDGETRVRLLEVDTPESVAPGRPVECWSEEAARELARLAPPGSTVRVQADRDLLDPYGRTLLYVWNARGAFVNLQLVREGAARAVLYEPNDRHIALMRAAEARARRAGLGVWGACPSFGAPA